MDTPLDLEARLQAVEKSLARSRRLLLLAGVSLSAVLILGASPQQDRPKGTIKADVLDARTLVVRDTEGRVRGSLQVDEATDKVSLNLLDEKGRVRARIFQSAKDVAAISLYGTNSDKPRAALGVDDQGQAAIRIDGDDGSSLRLDAESLTLMKSGLIRTRLQKAASSKAQGLGFFDKDGKPIR